MDTPLSIFFPWHAKPNTKDSVRDSLAPQFWRDRFGAVVLAQDVLAQRGTRLNTVHLIDVKKRLRFLLFL